MARKAVSLRLPEDVAEGLKQVADAQAISVTELATRFLRQGLQGARYIQQGPAVSQAGYTIPGRDAEPLRDDVPVPSQYEPPLNRGGAESYRYEQQTETFGSGYPPSVSPRKYSAHDSELLNRLDDLERKWLHEQGKMHSQVVEEINHIGHQQQVELQEMKEQMQEQIKEQIEEQFKDKVEELSGSPG